VRYKLVIFDFDGTLVDSFPWFVQVLNDVADRYRFRRVDPHQAEALRGQSAREMIRYLGIPASKMPLIARHMRKRKAEALDETHLFEGVDRMLRQLAASGLALAVVSSDAESNVRATLGAELSSLISHFGCGASIFGKPAKFRKVLRASGYHVSEAICIGDEIRDLEATQTAGIAFGAVAWATRGGPPTGRDVREHRCDLR
jgi:phosphoglycolate phosphatase